MGMLLAWCSSIGHSRHLSQRERHQKHPEIAKHDRKKENKYRNESRSEYLCFLWPTMVGAVWCRTPVTYCQLVTGQVLWVRAPLTKSSASDSRLNDWWPIAAISALNNNCSVTIANKCAFLRHRSKSRNKKSKILLIANECGYLTTSMQTKQSL